MTKFIKYLFLAILIFGLASPSVNAEAKTLRDLKNELSRLQKEQNEAQNNKNKTQAEINAEKNKIADAHKQVEDAENKIAFSKEKIASSNEEINKMEDETSKLLQFYQIMQGDNSVMEYVTGSSSLTDLIRRYDAVSQILSYNKTRLKSLEELIITNEQLQIDLAKMQKDLENKIEIYQDKVNELNEGLSDLVEISMDISTQIKSQKELIDHYEKNGCKDDDLLSNCVDITNNTRWMRPTNRGLISSGFGYRSFILNGKPYSDFHPAVDIAGNPGGTPVYAAASGTVAAVVRKDDCGGNQIYIHVRVNGVAYTIHYAHLLEIKVKVGQKVTVQTIVGTVGGGGSTIVKYGGWDKCSTGWHLHFGVAKGFYLLDTIEGYSKFSEFIANSIKPTFMPKYGKWFYSRI